MKDCIQAVETWESKKKQGQLKQNAWPVELHLTHQASQVIIKITTLVFFL
jgi:hypothetical protein